MIGGGVIIGDVVCGGGVVIGDMAHKRVVVIGVLLLLLLLLLLVMWHMKGWRWCHHSGVIIIIVVVGDVGHERVAEVASLWVMWMHDEVGSGGQWGVQLTWGHPFPGLLMLMLMLMLPTLSSSLNWLSSLCA